MPRPQGPLVRPSVRPPVLVKQKFFNKMFAFPQFKNFIECGGAPAVAVALALASKKEEKNRRAHGYNNRGKYTLAIGHRHQAR